MTRFDADAPDERQKLFAEAIAAHRERTSAFATFEADEDASTSDAADIGGGEGDDGTAGSDAEATDGNADDAGNAEESADAETAEAPPWIQFGDGTINLDCTDDELAALKTLLGEFPAFKIDDINRPEEAEGVNVRVSALADPNRVAQYVERVFREVYDQPEGYRAWVTAV